MQLAVVAKEDFTKQLLDGFERRRFITGHVVDCLAHLTPLEAFALSRLLPKALLEKILADRQSANFVDKILDYHAHIAANGPIEEMKATKSAEETFLATEANEILDVLLNR